MEERKKNFAKLGKSEQPVKTEWGAQYVVFTYFQGDINSVVDEHFSRALSATRTPQDLSSKSSGEEMTESDKKHTSPHLWNFSPHWAKPYGASSPLNLSGSEGDAAPATAESYDPPDLQGIAPRTAAVWHLPSGGNPCLAVAPGYLPPGPDLHMAQGAAADEKYGSLLGLLQQESCPPPVQQPPDPRPACLTGSARSPNMSLTSMGGIQANGQRRDLYY